MTITAKFPLAYAGQNIPAGATAELPDNLARLLIARGQAKPAAQASAQAPAIASAQAGAGSSTAPKAPPKSPAVP